MLLSMEPLDFIIGLPVTSEVVDPVGNHGGA